RLTDKPRADIECVTLAAWRMLRRYAACFIEGSASAKKPRLPLKSYVYRGYVFVLAVSLNTFRKRTPILAVRRALNPQLSSREASRFTSCFCAQRFGGPILSAALYRVDGGLPPRKDEVLENVRGCCSYPHYIRCDRELD